MSLINDALKRTRDASYQGGNPRPIDPMASYRVNSATKSGTGTVLKVAGVVGLGLLIAGGVMWKLSSRPTPTPTVKVAAPPVAPVQPEPPPPAPAPVVIDDQLVTKIVEKLKTETPATPAPVSPPVAPAPVPEPPKLTLQGITSDGVTREALINGVSVRVGEEIEGAKVIAIESRRVRLQFGDRELSLRMP